MFKKYGTQSPVEASPLMERIKKYVPEARERYGLVGRDDITDDEIAGALYKKAMSLSKPGNAAVNEFGEPLLLFRGDTRRYPSFKPRITPEELGKGSGTMDNSLGNLFLGDYPKHFSGADRYMGTIRKFNGEWSYVGSGTGSDFIKGVPPLEQNGIAQIPEGARLLYSGEVGKRKRPIEVYKAPAKYLESGVNDLNGFIVNTKAVRNATPEISVLNDDLLVQGFKGTTPHMSTKYIEDATGFPMYLHPDGTTTPALAGYEPRQGMAEHYRFVLDDAKTKGEGLLKSTKGSILREEHSGYDYYALPNFNINGAKSILPYDLNRPTFPFIDRGLLYRKHGGIIKRK